jgi:hypothetical protein
MRFLLTFLFLFEFLAHAEVFVDIAPQSPVVINSNFTSQDGVIHSGPWFNTTLVVVNTNSPNIVFSGFEVDVENPLTNMTKKFSFYLNEIIELGPNENFVMHNVYFEGLPDSKDYAYNVTLRPLGWVGTIRHPRSRLDAVGIFKTR